MAGKIWVREIRRNKILRDVVVPCAASGWEDALSLALRELDVMMPLVVARHRRDFEAFGQTRFLPEHFLESVNFDRLEVEFFDGQAGKEGR